MNQPKQDWRTLISELNPNAPFIGEPGDTKFDRAIIGIGQRCGQPDLLVYDYDLIVQVLMEDDNMEEDEAREFADFNICGAWLGENTPIIMSYAKADEA